MNQTYEYFLSEAQADYYEKKLLDHQEEEAYYQAEQELFHYLEKMGWSYTQEFDFDCPLHHEHSTKTCYLDDVFTGWAKDFEDGKHVFFFDAEKARDFEEGNLSHPTIHGWIKARL